MVQTNGKRFIIHGNDIHKMFRSAISSRQRIIFRFQNQRILRMLDKFIKLFNNIATLLKHFLLKIFNIPMRIFHKLRFFDTGFIPTNTPTLNPVKMTVNINFCIFIMQTLIKYRSFLIHMLSILRKIKTMGRINRNTLIKLSVLTNIIKRIRNRFQRTVRINISVLITFTINIHRNKIIDLFRNDIELVTKKFFFIKFGRQSKQRSRQQIGRNIMQMFGFLIISHIFRRMYILLNELTDKITVIFHQ